MTRPILPALCLAALLPAGIIGANLIGGDDTLTIASDGPPLAATVPDSLTLARPEVPENGTAPATQSPFPLGDWVARVDTPAVRLDPPVPPTTIAPPIDGYCETWRPLLERYGIPYDEARPVMVRESQCKMVVNDNPGTADLSFGPLQVNRYGSLAAWWDEGGYTYDVMATPEGAVAAAAVLYHSCGWSPWRAPYGCDGDYLQVPAPEWGAW